MKKILIFLLLIIITLNKSFACLNGETKRLKDGITFSGVSIYNHFGTLVFSQQIDKAKELTIPLKDLRAGLYLVQITEGEHSERHQIIVE